MSVGPSNEGFGSILPSDIFGAPKAPSPKMIEDKGTELAGIVKEKLVHHSAEGKDLKKLINAHAGDDYHVMHFALKLLKKDADLEEYKNDLADLDKEVLQVIQERSNKTLMTASPKTISLAEGDLPAIPEKERKLIEGFMYNNMPLLDVMAGLNLTSENARQVLRYIKVIDLERDRTGRSDYQSTYPLRTICLQASNGAITTFEAYTKSIKEALYSNPFSPASREYAAHEYNYIPERVRDHGRILNECAVEMMALSKRLNPDERTIFCIGGNTAVGKSRCAAQDRAFSKGLLQGEMIGALNPDTMKYKLRKDTTKVTNQQVHVEGFAVGQKLSLELQNKALKASMIIDERLGTVPSINNIILLATTTGAKVVLKDIDGPLMTSCLRVLCRNINTDPCVPFGPISGGYKVIRENRASIVEIIKKSDAIKSYQLFATNKQNQQQLVAVKENGVFKILDEELYKQALSSNVDTEITQTKNTIITEEFIESVKNLPGVSADALKQYLGKTIEEALDAHSKKMPL